MHIDFPYNAIADSASKAGYRPDSRLRIEMSIVQEASSGAAMRLAGIVSIAGCVE